MRRFADTLPTLRGGEILRAEPRDDALAFAPVLGSKLSPSRPANAVERSRLAQAEILERTVAGLERSGQAPAGPRRATIPSLDGDAETAISARIAEAVAAAHAAAERERELAGATARREADEALAEARARWAEAEGKALADSLARRLDALEASLSAGLSRIIAPLLETAVHERALARFRDILDGFLSGPRRAAIVVKGPDDLLDAFRAVWGDRPGLRFEIAERAELVADIGPTRIETSLVPFKTALAEALGTPHPTLSPKDRQNVQ